LPTLNFVTTPHYVLLLGPCGRGEELGEVEGAEGDGK